MTNAEDDPRSVDWAPTKIVALQLDTANLRHNLQVEIKQRETNEQSMAHRITELEDHMAPNVELEKRVTSLERQLEDMSENFTKRMDSIENRLAAYGVPEAGSRWDRVVDEFGPVIGGTERSVSIETETGIGDRPQAKPVKKLGGIFAIGDPTRGVVPSETSTMERLFEASWNRGAVVALENAEKRVRDYMRREDVPYTETEIKNVIRALRG